MEIFTHKSERTLQIDKSIIAPNLVAGITTRHGGVSQSPFDSLNIGLHVKDNEEHVKKNRQLIAEELNMPIERWVIGEQVHGTNIHVVKGGISDRKDKTSVPAIDGLITKQPGILLGAFFADCVPLYFWDSTSSWIGIAHAGWKGTVSLMGKHMVEALQNQGVNISTLHAAIGPAISKANYQVDTKVYKKIPDQFISKVTKEVGEEQYLLDLPRLNELILIEAGLSGKNIHRTNYCTYNDSLFYSHRRDHQQTGRMLGYIGKRL